MTIAGIIGLLVVLIPVIGQILKLFDKTPEEKERERIEDETKERQEKAMERNEAIKNAKAGKTSDLERIIND